MDDNQDKSKENRLENEPQDETGAAPDPFEINFLPQFLRNRGPREPFVNKHGVVIGDHEYESEHSPLQNWSTDVDPAVMAGDEWVHPFKDIGFHTDENRDYFEKGIPPQSGVFMHPDKDAAYGAYGAENDGAPPRRGGATPPNRGSAGDD